eukprot:PLAT8944.1.p1 GENE.PLAT8944.1~~PLAT8944.1.p1  ORF type:complete len:194 (+),score=87.65 PLAT8944.1:33-584(+)
MAAAGGDGAFTFELWPDRRLNVLVFHRVTNTDAVVKAVVDGSLPAAVLNADRVAHVDQLLSAANRALAHEDASGGPRTKSLHSDLLYFLSPATSISTAFKNFGPTADSSRLLLAIFDSEEGQLEAVRSAVEGEEVSVSCLASALSEEAEAEIRRVYKIKDKEMSSADYRLVDALQSAIAVAHL